MTATTYVSMATPVTGAADDSAVLNYPAGILVGDLLVALISIDAGVGQTINTIYGASAFQNQIARTSIISDRRAIAAYWRAASGAESGTDATFSVLTTAQTGRVGGTIAIVRGADTGLGSHSNDKAGITSSTSPAPADITSTVNDELALACIAYNNTDTIGAINASGWAEGEAEKNDGFWSYSFQIASLATPQTITGGNATMGTSGPWGVITCAIKPFAPFYLPKALIIN